MYSTRNQSSCWDLVWLGFAHGLGMLSRPLGVYVCSCSAVSLYLLTISCSHNLLSPFSTMTPDNMAINCPRCVLSLSLSLSLVNTDKKSNLGRKGFIQHARLTSKDVREGAQGKIRSRDSGGRLVTSLTFQAYSPGFHCCK